MDYREEFPDFVMDVEIPAGWIDTSWHNDVSPSFETRGLRIWVDFADPGRREFEDRPRFTVAEYTDDMDWVADHLSTDDWSAVLQFVAAYVRS